MRLTDQHRGGSPEGSKEMLVILFLQDRKFIVQLDRAFDKTLGQLECMHLAHKNTFLYFY